MIGNNKFNYDFNVVSNVIGVDYGGVEVVWGCW